MSVGLEHGLCACANGVSEGKIKEKKRKEKQLKPNENYLSGADSVVQHYHLSLGYIVDDSGSGLYIPVT